MHIYRCQNGIMVFYYYFLHVIFAVFVALIFRYRFTLGIELVNRVIYFTIKTEYIGYIEMIVYHDP